MSKLNMVVQGKAVNQTVINAFAKRVGSLDEIFSVWANAATLQLAQHGNNSWLVSLFESQPLRLKNGELSKLGQEVLGYIRAFYPLVKWDKETQKVGRAKVQPDSVLHTHFVDPTVREADTAAVLTKTGAFVEVVELRGKFYREHGDFSMTLAQWRNRETAPKEGSEDDTLPTVTAKQFAKQLDKSLSALNAKRFVGASDELKLAADKAKSAYLMLEALLAAAVETETPIDQDKAAELLKSGQAGKSKRAGGKVAPATEAVA